MTLQVSEKLAGARVEGLSGGDRLSSRTRVEGVYRCPALISLAAAALLGLHRPSRGGKVDVKVLPLFASMTVRVPNNIVELDGGEPRRVGSSQSAPLWADLKGDGLIGYPTSRRAVTDSLHIAPCDNRPVALARLPQRR